MVFYIYGIDEFTTQTEVWYYVYESAERAGIRLVIEILE